MELRQEVNVIGMNLVRNRQKKREIAGLGALKGVQVTLCGMRCIDLFKHFVKEYNKLLFF